MATTSGAALPAASQSWSDLPEGEGKRVVVEACSSCHGMIRVPKAAGRTRAEWRRTVLNMIGRGAMVYPEEIDAISSYLTEYFGAAVEPADDHDTGRGQ